MITDYHEEWTSSDHVYQRVTVDLDAVFDYAHYIRHVPEILGRLDAIPAGR